MILSLENEFASLMQLVIDKINDNKDNGAYTEYDAEVLLEKVAAVIGENIPSRYGNCPSGHTDPDCGWSPSMGYHC